MRKTRLSMHDSSVTTVTIGQGRLQGWRDGDVERWLGIPFAASPVGDRRWRPPGPAEGWDGVRDATQFGPDCPQQPWTGSRASGLDEDCLTLNVWAPARRRDDEPLPVLVWFYGGSFAFGSASAGATDGSALARRGAVVVAANYRVGLFGFLAHPGLSAESPHGSSGNYGLLDQLAALRWVKANIAAFGGDAGRVMAFGVSAGAASLGLLLTSPLAAGAFDRVILESPGCFRPLAEHRDAEQAGLLVGEDLDELRRLPAAEVLARTGRLTPAMRALTAARPGRPHRDGWVVPGQDRDAYAAGEFQPVPMIVGGNTDEGSALVASWPLHDRHGWERLLATDFAGAIDEAHRHYPVHGDADVRTQLAAVFGDTQFTLAVRGIARAAARRGVPTYRYLFARRPDHGAEVPFVFGTLDDGASATDRALSERMGDAWVRFAATGDPNGPGLATWPAADGRGEPALLLDTEHRVVDGHRVEQLDFLDRFLEGRHGGPGPGGPR